MKTFRLDDMVKGWFVGDFSPTALHSTVCEVAVKHYQAGDREELHHHKVAAELTLILKGRVRMCDAIYEEGDIVLLEPGEATAFEALTDAINVVVKLPSARGDKYLGSAEQ